MCDVNRSSAITSHCLLVLSWGEGQTSTAEENTGEMFNLVEGGLGKLGFKGFLKNNQLKTEDTPLSLSH